MAEDNWVGHFHHGGFQVQGKEYVLLFSVFHLFTQKFTQRFGVHHGGVDNFASQYRHLFFQYLCLAIGRGEFDFDRARLINQYGFLAAVKITRSEERRVGKESSKTWTRATFSSSELNENDDK